MIEVAILSILQGVAEFLPISSSGHLVLGKTLLGLGDVGMRLDIFLHVGTLLSIFVFYFSVIRRIVVRMEWSYMAKVVLSAVPAGIVGVCFKDDIEAAFASARMVGFALLFTGAVLTATKFLPRGGKDVSFLRALLMGGAQAVAILPGVSRSGMTLAAARASKVDAEKAAEFSFLMSAPPIGGAAALEILKAVKGAEPSGATEVGWGLCIFGALLAAVVGWIALRLLVASLKSRWFWLFGPYCLVAGLVVLLCSACGAAEPTRAPKALVVMLDGMRADAVENAHAPNLRMLRDGKWRPGYKCAWSMSACTILDAPTVSAPNHAAIATGVTSAKTKVLANGQFGLCNYTNWPSWLARLVDAKPQMKALFSFSWRPDEQIDPGKKVEYAHGPDAANAVNVPRRLAAADAPDATMWYIDYPDHGGHGFGYYPYTVGYLHYVHLSDKAIGDALKAIASRPTFADEDWLVIVTSDHGGYARGHGAMTGHCWTIPLLVCGRGVSQGRMPGEPHNYDAAATVLRHFGVDTSGMNLDGAAVGDRVAAAEPSRGLGDGLAAYFPFDGGSASNLVAAGPKAELRGGAALQGKDGLLGGCLRVAADTNGVASVRLGGSEGLSFENGTEFAFSAWVRLDGAQEIDSVIVGNADASSATNRGVAFVGARTVSTIKTPGVCLVGAFSGGRAELGPCVAEGGKWTFFAAARGADGVLALYCGGLDGNLYRIAADASGLELKTGRPFFIGQVGGGKSMKGEVDELAIWSRALTHSDIRAIYEAGRRGVALGDLL